MTNKLFYGDNLDVLRDHIASESVDLIYLDPPFNSNANYNILFKSKTGDGSDAQIEAFEDTWHWNDKAEDAFDQVARSGNTKAFDLLNAMRGFLGDNDMMAYLAMMAVRLLELHRVLKPTGSLYLHCDPTASHYLKLLLDGVFDPRNFQAEIDWQRTATHNDAKRWPWLTDILLCYSKSSAFLWHPLYREQSPEDVEKRYRFVDSDGRRYRLGPMDAPAGGGMSAINKKTGKPNGWYEWQGYQPPAQGWRYSPSTMQRLHDEGLINYPADKTKRLARKLFLDESKGALVGNIWTDIPPIQASAAERLGYPTQKPVALLERIIAASSNEGDVVLDPFCGCGTAIHAAQKLGRQWIGIDITHLAISLIEKRMRDAFPGIEFTVEGTPKDLASAQDLAERDKYQFQWWAVSMVDALPFGGKKKGADGGIDGIIYFKPDGKRTEKAIVSVKGGLNPSVTMVETLAACIEREKAPIGVLIMNAMPTREMEKRAAAVGRFEDDWGRTYPRLQIITLAELFQGKKPAIPFVDPASVKRAKREETGKQGSLI